jgi:hypothetical protein
MQSVMSHEAICLCCSTILTVLSARYALYIAAWPKGGEGFVVRLAFVRERDVVIRVPLFSENPDLQASAKTNFLLTHMINMTKYVTVINRTRV